MAQAVASAPARSAAGRMVTHTIAVTVRAIVRRTGCLGRKWSGRVEGIVVMFVSVAARAGLGRCRDDTTDARRPTCPRANSCITLRWLSMKMRAAERSWEGQRAPWD